MGKVFEKLVFDDGSGYQLEFSVLDRPDGGEFDGLVRLSGEVFGLGNIDLVRLANFLVRALQDGARVRVEGGDGVAVGASSGFDGPDSEN
jgi:hypothetical protein